MGKKSARPQKKPVAHPADLLNQLLRAAAAYPDPLISQWGRLLLRSERRSGASATARDKS
jgi:hypothetical protein